MDLTSARHDILHNSYANKYPESFSDEINKDLIYCGKNLLTDPSKTAEKYWKIIIITNKNLCPRFSKDIKKI